MGAQLIRILSDVHYADRASRVRSLEQLRPLLEGATSLILNGDTVDTRPDKNPARTAAGRAAVLDFFGSAGMPVTFLTGNHDPDLSGDHSLELHGGKVLVTHGDILFDSMVPWSKDAPDIGEKVTTALAAVPADEACPLESRLRVFRSVAATIPQRHQSETNPIRYALRFAGDTVWPPDKAFKILRAWREAPGRAAAMAARHRPKARFVLIGHTHKPGIWRMPSGVVVVNTGSFCRPFGALVADVSPDRLRIRKVNASRGQFRPGAELGDFPLS